MNWTKAKRQPEGSAKPRQIHPFLAQLLAEQRYNTPSPLPELKPAHCTVPEQCCTWAPASPFTIVQDNSSHELHIPSNLSTCTGKYHLMQLCGKTLRNRLTFTEKRKAFVVAQLVNHRRKAPRERTCVAT